MSEEAMCRNLMQLGMGIQACIEKKLQTPALVLLYSAIDITAWINNDDHAARVGKQFTAWVNDYLLKAKALPCTATDLYAARCGLVHTLTAESDLSKSGKARLICYAWGEADVEKLRHLTKIAQMDARYAIVHIEELYEAWRHGLLLWTEELAKDQPRAARAHARASKFFGHMSMETVDDLTEKVTTALGGGTV